MKHVFAAMISLTAEAFQLTKLLICTLEEETRNTTNDDEHACINCLLQLALIVNIDSANMILNFG